MQRHGFSCTLYVILSFMKRTPTLELILRDEVQKLLDGFAAALKIRVVFFGLDKEIIKSTHQMERSKYCLLIQDRLFPGRCKSLDVEKMAECLKSKTLISYECHAGLNEAVAPVFIDHRLAGYVMIGQFRAISKIPKNVTERCDKHTPAAMAKRAFSKLPYVPAEQIEGILGMFTMLVDYIVARELVALRGDWVLDKVNDYIDKNLAKKITVHDVAHFTGRSVSSLSQCLRKKHGVTYNQILIEKRLERADDLMKSHSDLPIKEIAAQSGFEDPFYFSRLYRKHRKMTPSQAKLDFRSELTKSP